jgi:hypothetical protein
MAQRPLSLGRGCQGDLVAEGFELADEVALAGLGVGAGGEVVGAELLVGGALFQHVPDDDDEGVGDGEDGFALAFGAEAAHEAPVLGRQ